MLWFKKDYLTKEEQIKKGFWKGIILGVVVATILIIGIYQMLVVPYAKKLEKDNIISKLEKDKQTKKILRLNKDIKQGDLITAESFYEDIATERFPKNCIVNKNELKNKVVRMDLLANTPLTSSMVLDKEDTLTPDLRNQDYGYITLHKNLKKGDFVDIRLQRKDGTDFIVAAKKKVIELNGGTFAIKITEEERFYINNATVDAAITSSKLYTTIYVDPQNQPAAKITYPINENIKDLIQKNPNVVKDAEKEIMNRNNNGSGSGDSNNKQNDQQSSDGKPQFIENKK